MEILEQPYEELTIEDLKEPVKGVQGGLVDNILDKKFNFSFGDTGRFYNPLTNLRKDLREHLKYKGDKLVGVDISNSVPFFSLSMLEQDNPDEALYEALVVDGDLYKYMYQKWMEKGLETVAKIELLSLLNQPTFFKSKTREVLKEVFPTVEEKLCSWNNNKRGGFARRVQKVEADFTLGSARELITMGIPVFTIHDALYTTEECLEIVTRHMLDKSHKQFSRSIPLKLA